jgi:hypothetical protein
MRREYDRRIQEMAAMHAMAAAYTTPTPTGSYRPPTGPPPPSNPDLGDPSQPVHDFREPYPSPVTPFETPVVRRPSRSGIFVGAAIAAALLVVVGFAAQRTMKERKPKPLPTSSASLVASGAPLSSDDQITIRMACGKFQAGSDRTAYDACRADLIRIAASTEAPSFDGVPAARVMKIKLACDEHQLRGDLAAHRKCLHDKLAEP